MHVVTREWERPMIIDTNYGYPLIQIEEADGVRSWYFPRAEAIDTQVTTEYLPPVLIAGTPYVEFYSHYNINMFVPKDMAKYPIPIVLSVVDMRKVTS